jgi:N-acetylated-alpha-linked acidic dipeptidase
MIRIPRPSLLVIASLLATTVVAAAVPPDASNANDTLFGFDAASASRQQNTEQRFDAMLDPADLNRWNEQLSSEPNNVGSPHDKQNAEFVLKMFREWGWDAHIETFSVLYPTPEKVSLEMISPTKHIAGLNEFGVAGDPSSAIRKNALPPYNVYGGDGDVTAELVYVNYGIPEDYAELARRGIDVRGKIVIARYGGGWRGIKPKLAEQHGAIGCLIYSDPHEDGYFRGDVYPKGGWRPPQGVQRGSVADMLIYPGDPLTPGVGATADARRLPIKDAKTILHIPVLPISYGDAEPLLKSLAGPVAPESWRGALPITYHIGAGPTKVHMVVKSNWGQKTIYDVIAKLQGSTWPDQWIVRGNHRDGWVFGAGDPLSGTVAMMAEAKSLGAMYKQGWRPKRTIVYGSWDGEEPGLLGSTEWAETHAGELEDKAVLYLNTDDTGRGFLHAGGSHSLQHLVNQVAASVTDPETGASVLDRQRAMLLVSAYEGSNPRFAAGAKQAEKGGDLPISALGSGSDFSPFLQHLGIAALNIGFGGESDTGGVYHSQYDTHYDYVRFGDPGFKYGVTLAKVSGRIVMRTADADVLPMRFGDFAHTLDGYVGELHKLADGIKAKTAQQHRLLDAGLFKLAADPSRPLAPPARDSDVPAIDLSPLDEAASRLEESVKAYQDSYAKQAANGFRMTAARQKQVNELMLGMERALTDPAGLPGRSWYKHMIYAPGMFTGYGVKTVPAVREALEGRRWDEANRYAVVTAKVLDHYRARLDELTAAMN